MAKVVLKLGGKPLELKPDPPAVRTIKAFLDAAPKNEVFDRVQLANATKLSLAHVKDLGWSESLSSYTHRWGTKRLWGNPAAIDELKRQLEAR